MSRTRVWHPPENVADTALNHIIFIAVIEMFREGRHAPLFLVRGIIVAIKIIDRKQTTFPMI